MSFEAAAFSFAGVAFMWLANEQIKTRDAVMKLSTIVTGDSGQGGIYNRVEGLASRTHVLEAGFTKLKADHEALDERVTRLENNL